MVSLYHWRLHTHLQLSHVPGEHPSTNYGGADLIVRTIVSHSLSWRSEKYAESIKLDMDDKLNQLEAGLTS